MTDIPASELIARLRGNVARFGFLALSLEDFATQIIREAQDKPISADALAMIRESCVINLKKFGGDRRCDRAGGRSSSRGHRRFGTIHGPSNSERIRVETRDT